MTAAVHAVWPGVGCYYCLTIHNGHIPYHPAGGWSSHADHGFVPHYQAGGAFQMGRGPHDRRYSPSHTNGAPDDQDGQRPHDVPAPVCHAARPRNPGFSGTTDNAQQPAQRLRDQSSRRSSGHI